MYFKNIEDTRHDSDYTQEQVAQMLNCKREVYRRWEKGIREIPVWALLKLADIYQVNTDYLLGRTKLKTPYPKDHSLVQQGR